MHYAQKNWIQNDCDSCHKVRCNSTITVVHCDGQHSHRDKSTISSLQTHLESSPVQTVKCLLSATISHLDPWLQNLYAHTHTHAHIHTHMCANTYTRLQQTPSNPTGNNYIPDHTRARKITRTHTHTHACTHTRTEHAHTKHIHTHTYTRPSTHARTHSHI